MHEPPPALDQPSVLRTEPRPRVLGKFARRFLAFLGLPLGLPFGRPFGHPFDRPFGQVAHADKSVSSSRTLLRVLVCKEVGGLLGM